MLTTIAMNLSFENHCLLHGAGASEPKSGRIGYEQLRDGAPCKARRLRRREAVLRETPPPPPSRSPRGIHKRRACWHTTPVHGPCAVSAETPGSPAGIEAKI